MSVKDNTSGGKPLKFATITKQVSGNFSITFDHKPAVFILDNYAVNSHFRGTYIDEAEMADKYDGEQFEEYKYFGQNITVVGLSSITNNGLTFNFTCNQSGTVTVYYYY